MTNSKKTTEHGDVPAAHASDKVVHAFGQKLAKDDFGGAEMCIPAPASPGAPDASAVTPASAPRGDPRPSAHPSRAMPGDAALHARLAGLLIIEIETRLENSKISSAKKCLALLLKCAPEREEEAHMWFADYYLGSLRKSLSSGGLASYGHDLENFLSYAPSRKAEAYSLIAQYYMAKLKRCIAEGRGNVAEMKALSELVRYAPSRKDEAYHLFAERALEEMNQALSDHDKEYAKIALNDFLKFAPHRESEAQQVWEQHMQAYRQRKLYDILGVERTATYDEIRLAYRQLAKRLHPDVNLDHPSAAEQMRHVNAAYAILGDAELRARYDQRGDRKEKN